MISRILICTIGLPRSGKTTWCRAMAAAYGWPIVNPDSVRLAMHGQRYAAEAEGLVWATVHIMIKALFLAGHETVLLDATNTSRKRRDVMQSADWQTAFHHIATDEQECMIRAAAAGDDLIQPVIMRMSKSFEPLLPHGTKDAEGEEVFNAEAYPVQLPTFG